MGRVYVAFFVLIPVLLAQDPDDIARNAGKAAQVNHGRAQFAQLCGFCHGRDARGGTGPDLIRSPLVNHDVNGELISDVVRNGRPDKGMPAFQLSNADLRDITVFLHDEMSHAAAVSQQTPADYPVEKLLVGNAERGKQYFGQHCGSCHSASGDLAHIASKYKPFELQTRLAFPQKVKRKVRVGDVEGELVYADEFHVSLRGADGWVHTYPRSDGRVKIIDPVTRHEDLLRAYTDSDLHDLFAYVWTLK